MINGLSRLILKGGGGGGGGGRINRKIDYFATNFKLRCPTLETKSSMEDPFKN